MGDVTWAYLFWTAHVNPGQLGFQVGNGGQCECVWVQGM